MYYLLNLMKDVRAAIINDKYPAFVKSFFGKIYDNRREAYPKWAVDALKKVGVDLLAG